jgi:predicted nucleic acid-binding protein
LSAITLAEIQAGISQLERKGSARRAAALAHWLSAILELYDSRTLSFTSSAALEAGRLLDRAIGAGANPGFEDAAIAATAAVHNLTIVTANARHFEHFGVPFISPFDELTNGIEQRSFANRDLRASIPQRLVYRSAGRPGQALLFRSLGPFHQ